MARRVRSLVGVIGAVGAGALSAAIVNSPLAYATDPPDLPPSIEFIAPGVFENSTNEQNLWGASPLAGAFTENNFYNLYDSTNQLEGSYETLQTSEHIGLDPILLHGTEEVLSSTGTAPAEGTVWETDQFGAIVVGPALSFVGNQYTTVPDGTFADLFNIFGGQVFGNFFVTGPAGTADDIEIFNTWLPLFDTSAGGAMSTGLDALGLGGLTDLSALGSELANTF